MAPDPLEQLSRDEFQPQRRSLRTDQGITDAHRFASVALEEPPKAELKTWRSGDPLPRRSFAYIGTATTSRPTRR